MMNENKQAGSSPDDRPLQFMQVIIARGRSYQNLLSWRKLSSLLVMRVPIEDQNAIAIFGAGKFFDALYCDDLMCICLDEFDTPQKGSCLKELVEYLAEGVEHGSPASFS